LQIAQIPLASARDFDFPGRQHQPEQGDDGQDPQRRQRLLTLERGSRDGMQEIERDNVHIKFAQSHGEFDPLRRTFPESQNAAAAKANPCPFHRPGRIQAVSEGMSGHNLLEKRPGGFEIVIETDHPP